MKDWGSYVEAEHHVDEGNSFDCVRELLQETWAVKCREQCVSNLRLKLAWLVAQHKIDKARVVNLDETGVSLLPTHSHGWSTRGWKSEQAVGDKCSITATVAMTMSERQRAGILWERQRVPCRTLRRDF